jgi:hypothetical protein
MAVLIGEQMPKRLVILFASGVVVANCPSSSNESPVFFFCQNSEN